MEAITEKYADYRAAIEEILTDIAAGQYLEEGIRDRAIFDEQKDSYAVISAGWADGKEWVHDVVADLEIINGKVWIHADNTDVVIARQLERRGVPKSDIVLGFRPPEVRLETGYAVA